MATNIKHKILERDIRRELKQALEFSGWTVFHNFQGLGSFRGYSDLTAIRNGRTIFLEVKGPDGRQSLDQLKFQNLICDAGGEYRIARSIDDIKDLCEGYLVW
ncbi:MAG: VRR-NUC domain-containing protein [Acidobacteria bacterium]|jgi:hypothetical protein|nr:VRR-NUC domain-containing protein [Acidobacteriota bacterium]